MTENHTGSGRKRFFTPFLSVYLSLQLAQNMPSLAANMTKAQQKYPPNFSLTSVAVVGADCFVPRSPINCSFLRFPISTRIDSSHVFCLQLITSSKPSVPTESYHYYNNSKCLGKLTIGNKFTSRKLIFIMIIRRLIPYFCNIKPIVLNTKCW